MAASFPVTFPSALSITGTQTLEDVGHTDNLHIKDRDEIIAAQTKLGLGSSVASGTTALLGTGGTQSAWGQITNAYIAGTAAVAVSKLAPASANGSVLTTAAGTATWALLTNDNIAGTAAIAVTKIAAGSPGSVLRTNSGGTVAWGQVQPGDLATGAVSAVGQLGDGTVTMKLLAGTVLAGTVGNVTISGIPSGYASLHIEVLSRTNIAGTAVTLGGIRLNSDAGMNYFYEILSADGTTVAASGGANDQLALLLGAQGSTPANSYAYNVISIGNYSGTLAKSLTGYSAAVQGTVATKAAVYFVGGYWAGSVALGTIQFISGGSFVPGSAFRVWGMPA